MDVVLNNQQQLFNLPNGSTLTLRQASPGATAIAAKVYEDAASGFTTGVLNSTTPLVIGPVTANCRVLIATQGSVSADTGGSGGGGTWGSIAGTLSAQGDLNTALGLKAPGGGIVALAGTSLTINSGNASTYNGNIIVSGNAAATLITLSTGLPAGFHFAVEQGAAGQVTIAGGGATLNAPAGASTMGLRTMLSVTPEATDTYVVTPPLVGPTINFQTGASYTATAADIGNTVDMANAGANTFTIPLDAAVSSPVGAKLIVRMGAAGATTIAMAGGTLTKPAARSLTISAQGEYAVCTKQAANTWDVVAS